MPKSGSGITLRNTPRHLPPDISQFKIHNIISGPIEVSPKERDSMSFDVPVLSLNTNDSLAK